MNRNRYKKVVAIATATTVSVASLTGCQSATDTKSTTKTEASNEVTPNTDKTSKKPVQDGVDKKTETVFAKADAAGTVNDITVSSWLKNGKGIPTISDITDLADIKNVKGEEGFQADGSNVSWDANGNDIYYQGKSNKTLPVNVKITYTLDGAEIQPSDLAGKSGHVKMRFDYSNNQKMIVKVNGKDEEVNVPFAIMTGTILDNEKFSNITVTNGQMINDGTRTVVAGFALPGLKDSLFDDIDSEYKDKVDDIDIPSYVEVEADVADFQVDMTLSVVLNDFFNEINTDDFGNIDDIKDKVKEMKDKFNDIVNGTDKLDDGIEKLQSGSNKLNDGAGQLAAGATKLTGNSKKLNDGASALMKGLQSAEKGDKSLAAGLDKLSAGATKLSNGVNGLFKGEESLTALKAGTNALVAGFNRKDKKTGETLLSGSKKLAEQTQDIDKTIDKVKHDVLKKIPGILDSQITPENVDVFAAAIVDALGEEYIAGVEKTIIKEIGKEFNEQANAMLKPYKEKIGAAVGISADKVDATVVKHVETQLKAGVVTEGLTVEQRTGMVEQLCEVEQLKGAMTAVEGIEGTLAKGLSKEQKAKLQTKVIAMVKEALKGDSGDKLVDALEPIITNVTADTIDEIKKSDDIKQLKAGCKAIADGIDELYDGSKKIDAGTSKLEAGIRTQLKPGANELAKGAAAAKEGNTTLYSGLKQLSSGSATLEKGVLAYTGGAATLANGINTLKAGTASAVSGVAQLKEGSAKLSSGTKEYQEKAINKIADVVDKNFDQVKDKLTAVVKAGQSYNSFSGLNSDMEGSVKFVIETAAIGDSDK